MKEGQEFLTDLEVGQFPPWSHKSLASSIISMTSGIVRSKRVSKLGSSIIIVFIIIGFFFQILFSYNHIFYSKISNT